MRMFFEFIPQKVDGFLIDALVLCIDPFPEWGEFKLNLLVIRFALKPAERALAFELGDDLGYGPFGHPRLLSECGDVETRFIAHDIEHMPFGMIKFVGRAIAEGASSQSIVFINKSYKAGDKFPAGFLFIHVSICIATKLFVNNFPLPVITRSHKIYIGDSQRTVPVAFHAGFTFISYKRAIANMISALSEEKLMGKDKIATVAGHYFCARIALSDTTDTIFPAGEKN